MTFFQQNDFLIWWFFLSNNLLNRYLPECFLLENQILEQFWQNSHFQNGLENSLLLQLLHLTIFILIQFLYCLQNDNIHDGDKNIGSINKQEGWTEKAFVINTLLFSKQCSRAEKNRIVSLWCHELSEKPSKVFHYEIIPLKGCRTRIFVVETCDLLFIRLSALVFHYSSVLWIK